MILDPLKFIPSHPGWEKLLRQLSDFLKKHPECDVDCIKEKFGGLRVYGTGPEEHPFWDLLVTLEDQSLEMCELCGKPGEVVKQNSWLMVRCPEHAHAHSTNQ